MHKGVRKEGYARSGRISTSIRQTVLLLPTRAMMDYRPCAYRWPGMPEDMHVDGLGFISIKAAPGPAHQISSFGCEFLPRRKWNN